MFYIEYLMHDGHITEEMEQSKADYNRKTFSDIEMVIKWNNWLYLWYLWAFVLVSISASCKITIFL